MLALCGTATIRAIRIGSDIVIRRIELIVEVGGSIDPTTLRMAIPCNCPVVVQQSFSVGMQVLLLMLMEMLKCLLVHHLCRLFMGIIVVVLLRWVSQCGWHVVRVFRQEMRENGIWGGIGDIIVINIICCCCGWYRGLWRGYLANLGRSWCGDGLWLDGHLRLIQS